MKQYTIHYGNTVPYKSKTVTSWTESVKFMKSLLDDGAIVRSVSKEYVDDVDERDTLVKSVDIIGDR